MPLAFFRAAAVVQPVRQPNVSLRLVGKTEGEPEGWETDMTETLNHLNPTTRRRGTSVVDLAVVGLGSAVVGNLPNGSSRLASRMEGDGRAHDVEMRFDDGRFTVFCRSRLERSERRTWLVLENRPEVGDPSAMRDAAADGLAELRRAVLYRNEAAELARHRTMTDEVRAAAAGAACLAEPDWSYVHVAPRSRDFPPGVSVGIARGSVRRFGAERGPFREGLISRGLVDRLSAMPSHIHVVAGKPNSDSGLEIRVGAAPSITILNDLTSIDRLRVMRSAKVNGYALTE